MYFSSTQREWLFESLREWFVNNQELGRFLRHRVPPERTWDELPGEQVSKARFFEAATELLIAHGLIDGELFNALRQVREHRVGDINALERALRPLLDESDLPFVTRDQAERALQVLQRAFPDMRSWRAFQPADRDPEGADLAGAMAAKIRACGSPRALLELLRTVPAVTAQVQHEREQLIEELRVATQAAFLSEHIQAQDQARFDNATECFDAERYAEARDHFRALLSAAEARREGGIDDDPQLAWIDECRLNLARAELCTQDSDSARAHLIQVDPARLNIPLRERLVMELAALEELEPAEQAASTLDSPSDEVRWSLSLARQQIPEEDLSLWPKLQLWACRVALSAGDAVAVWQRLKGLINGAPLSKLHACMGFELCVELLQRCLLEVPRSTALPEATEWTAILTATRTLNARTREIEEGLPQRARELMLLPRLTFARLEERRPANAELDEARVKFPWFIRQLNIEPGDPSARSKVEQMTRELGQADHPWLGLLEWARHSRARGDLPEALRELEALAAEYPRSPPILYLLGCCLLDLGRAREAIAPLEQAFGLFPGWGYRLQLTKTLGMLGELQPAWEVLKSFQDDDDVEILELRARLSVALRLADSVDHARRWAGIQPDNPTAHIFLAIALERMGTLPEAADVAWRAFELGRLWEMTPEHIRLLSGLQHGQQREIRNERLLQMDQLLVERFPETPAAIQVRFELHLRRDGAEALSPALVEPLVQLGVLRVMPLDETREIVLRGQNQRDALPKLWAIGAIDCEWMRLLRGDLWIAWIAAQDSSSILFPLAPPALLDPTPANGENRAVLVGELELMLLARLELLDAASNSPYQVLVFEDVFERIVDADTLLETATERESIALEATERWAEQREIIWLNEENSPASREVNGDRGACFVGETGADNARWMTPGRLIRWLSSQEPPTTDHPPLRDAGSVSAPPPAGEVLELSFGALIELHRHMALDPVLRVAKREGWRLAIGQSALNVLQERKRWISLRRRAFEHLARVQSWLKSGLQAGVVTRIPRPDPTSLLPRPVAATSSLIPPEHERAALTWWQALEQDSTRLLCSAELRVGNLMLTLPQPAMWSSVASEDLGRISARLEPLIARVLTLPELVRRLIPEVARRIQPLSELARLGFHDALEHEELLYLEHRYEGLGGAYVRALLEAPAKATDPAWLGWPLAAFNRSVIAAVVIWTAHTPSSSTERARRLTLDLLNLIEEQQSSNHYNCVENVVAWLGITALEEPIASTVPSGAETGRIDRESPVGQVWQSVAAWAEGNERRRSAVGMGWNRVYRHLASKFGAAGPPELSIGPLALMGMVLEADSDKLPIRPALASLYALTALWDHKLTRKMEAEFRRADGQLARFNAEDFLQAVARAWTPGAVGDQLAGLDLRVRNPLQPDAWLAVPPEALLLRCEPTFRAQLARELASNIGAHDAIQRAKLLRLAENPSSEDETLAVATQASRAVWREVRTDPSVILRWSLRSGDTLVAPCDIEELAEILDEVALADEPAAQAYWRRFESNERYTNRSDIAALLAQLTLLPGQGPALAASIWLHHARAISIQDEVADLPIATLKTWREKPIGRISYALNLLWTLAGTHPVITWQGQPQELLPLCRATLVDLLRSCIGPDSQPAKGRIRALQDAGLARIAAQAVDRLAEVSLEPSRRLWLSWRLFAWLEAQLRATEDGPRRLAELLDHAPTARPNDAQLDDMLDPFRMAGDGARYVACTALGALLTGAENLWRQRRQDAAQTDAAQTDAAQTDAAQTDAAQTDAAQTDAAQTDAAQTDATQTDADNPFPILELGEALEQELIRLCALPLTENEAHFWGNKEPSSIPWPHPTSLPGLALRVLLLADPRRFIALDAELRFTWIARMRGLLECRGPDGVLLHSICFAVALCADELSAPEQAEAAQVLGGDLTNDAPPKLAATFALIALYKAGREELRDRAHLLALNAIGHPGVCAFWLEAVQARQSGQLSAALQELLLTAEAAGLDPTPIVLSLSALLFSEDEEVRTDALSALTGLRGDPRFSQEVRLRSLWDIAERMEENL